MTNEEALEKAKEACKECRAKKGRCTKEERAGCFIYNARVALFYSVPEKPISKGYRDGKAGKILLRSPERERRKWQIRDNWCTLGGVNKKKKHKSGSRV